MGAGADYGYVASKFIGVPTNLDVTWPSVDLGHGGRVASKLVGTPMNLMATWPYKFVELGKYFFIP
jgi:hypothetical protein